MNFILSFLHNTHVNIADGISFTVREKRIAHATSFLSLNDVLFVSKFPVSLLFTRKLSTQNCYCAIFYFPLCVLGFANWNEK